MEALDTFVHALAGQGPTGGTGRSPAVISSRRGAEQAFGWKHGGPIAKLVQGRNEELGALTRSNSNASVVSNTGSTLSKVTSEHSYHSNAGRDGHPTPPRPKPMAAPTAPQPGPMPELPEPLEAQPLNNVHTRALMIAYLQKYVPKG